MTKSPLLSLHGAVPAEGPDEGVAAHYGDLFREQRALAGGSGFVDLSHRGVVTVGGADRLAWLHLLLTQHVENLAPRTATESLILSAHGHIEHALYLVDDGATTWMHVEPGTEEALLGYLESMKFFYRVDIADATDRYAVVFLPAGSITAVPAEWPVRETAYGRDVFVPRDRLESFAAASGPAIGVLAYEALRIEGHRPRLGLETDHRTIPHELGWLDSAVHLQKGCYRGQETVARVHNLGRPPRRLVFLHLDGSEVHLPAHGAPVRIAEEGADGRAVGFITSSARHWELGPIALALVKRNTPEGATLLAEETAAAQETVVAP
ncbi:YgfZ/GcvT domain-containing protein [Actinacidiphila sp. ITFR-21]|uniref:CAF17-like 4Fe-4S cluster assembly/insertion protein YgfZ n=1 Tax=Actinacidiphila sp. ITFR-21 TaxID=3075199 RepID=UPI00288B0AE9|nr:glycine cleavage T C-terminal barrel domain-containing protein [Streptomyces sp. ITFR-21]WNI17016.1 glycine cleavage T C-terminal barrel domain-containing protein [Streptomyces sp. ITFR-21]